MITFPGICLGVGLKSPKDVQSNLQHIEPLKKHFMNNRILQKLNAIHSLIFIGPMKIIYNLH